MVALLKHSYQRKSLIYSINVLIKHLHFANTSFLALPCAVFVNLLYSQAIYFIQTGGSNTYGTAQMQLYTHSKMVSCTLESDLLTFV